MKAAKKGDELIKEEKQEPQKEGRKLFKKCNQKIRYTRNASGKNLIQKRKKFSIERIFRAKLKSKGRSDFVKKEKKNTFAVGLRKLNKMCRKLRKKKNLDKVEKMSVEIITS